MKKALILATALIVVGFIITMAVLFYIGFDFYKLSTDEMTESTTYVDEAFDDVAIYTKAADPIIRLSTDGECRIVGTARKGTVFSAEVTDGILTVREKSAPGGKWYENIGIHVGGARVIIYLPDKAYKSIDIDVTSGDVIIDDKIYFENIKAQVTSGDVLVGKRDCDNILVETTSGDIKLSGVIASGYMALKSTSGDIEVNACDGEEISISTVSGDVEGSLLTGKSFEAYTTSGDIEIPRRSVGNPCRITTVSGDVEIDVLG